MARKPRFALPGYPQHVIQRGNNREACFFDDSDRRKYLDSLVEAAEKYRCQVHAYVLMSNHVHLLMTPDTVDGISQAMQSVGRRYVRHVNGVHRRTGTLWEGRYKASLVQTDSYLLTCYRYIELNPVRAGMVRSPKSYPWSSYRANAHGQEDPVLSQHSVYESLGATPEARQHAYRDLFQHDMDEGRLHEIRHALNRELVLGTERFKDEVQKMVTRPVRNGRPGRRGKTVKKKSGLRLH